MAYNNTYDSGDIAPATINGLAVAFITIVAFMPLIALLLLWAWFRKQTK